MSNADTLKLSYVEETTWGETPANPAMQIIRFTNESLSQTVSSTRSTEITNDRQTTDIIRTDVGVEGTLGIEFSLGTFDDFLQSALESDSVTSGIDYTATLDSASSEDLVIKKVGTCYTLQSSDISFVGITASVFNWFRINCADSANNGKLVKVIAANGSELMLTVVSLEPLVEETIAPSTGTLDFTLVGLDYIENGTTPKSFTFEKNWADLTGAYSFIKGAQVDSFELSSATEQIVSGSFTFIGKDETESATGITGATYTSATTTPVVDPIDGVIGALSCPVALGTSSTYLNPAITAFNFTTNNNLRRRKIIGTEAAISVGDGKFSVSGSFEAYYTKQPEFEAFLDNQARYLALGFTTTDTASVTKNAVAEFPCVKFSAGTREATGENTDIMASLEFEAYKGGAATADKYTMRYFFE